MKLIRKSYVSLKCFYKPILMVLGVFGIVFAALFLYEFANYRSYCVYISEKTPLNLRPDTPVAFNHVEVGKIQRIVFDKNDPKKITAVLRVSSDVPITKGTRANLDNDSFVLLIDQGTEKTPLNSNASSKYPFILTADEVTNEREVNLAKIASALDKFNELVESLLTKENTENLRQVIYSLQQVMNVFSANADRINNIIVNTDQITQETPPVVRKLSNQTLPRAYQVLNNVDELMITLNQLTKMLKDNPTVLIRGKPTPSLGPGEKLVQKRQSR